MADPGFPVGGRGPRMGGVDSRGGYVSKILYVETKESGPLGARAPGTPSRSANATSRLQLPLICRDLTICRRFCQLLWENTLAI